jgi:hypothetical protein
MSEPQAEARAGEHSEREHASQCDCPWCALTEFSRRWRKKSKAMGHFHQAQIEVMKGMRAFIDEAVERMEKEEDSTEPRVSKIEVE